MLIKPLGDTALLIEWEQEISNQIHAQVIDTIHRIKRASLPGIIEIRPAYCSLLIEYDYQFTTFYQLKEALLHLPEAPKKRKTEATRKFRIPVCYADHFGLDFSILEKEIGRSRTEIIHLHTQSTYQVFMLGFLPGFAYLGTLPDALQCSRLGQPRQRVPANSVGIAGVQTGVYPMEVPGGWPLIGRTPIPVFDPKKQQPILFKPGDWVQFLAITEAEYEKIAEDYNRGILPQNFYDGE